MGFKLLCSLIFFAGVAFCAETKEYTIQPKLVDNVKFKVYDKSFHKLIDTTQKAVLVYDKGVWLEGVQVLPSGDVVASDVKQNMLLTFKGLDSMTMESKGIDLKRLESKSMDSINNSNNMDKDLAISYSLSILKPSHFQNGHALDLHGNLLAASHGMRGIERLENGKWQLIVDSYNGGKLNSPNDLIVDSHGNVWFSDPRFGLKNPLESYGGVDMQGGDYLYHLSFLDSKNLDLDKSSKVKNNENTLNSNVLESNIKSKQIDIANSVKLVRLNAKGLQAPNGLAFSPDEKLLYVADSARAYDFSNMKLPAKILVYKVNANGLIDSGRVFANIDSGIPDGIKVDSIGNVWSSSSLGIIVFSPNGKKLGEILFPEIVGNLTFSLSRTQKMALQKQGINVELPNQAGKRLFVASGSKLYMLYVNVESGIKR